MKEFFYLEGAYIIFGLIVLAVTLYVTTRPFMGKGSVKIGMGSAFVVILIFIFAHYFITKQRMESVKKAFKEGKEILCENRVYTKGANFITIKKDLEWKLEGDYFKSPNYTRDFFLARCIVK